MTVLDYQRATCSSRSPPAHADLFTRIKDHNHAEAVLVGLATITDRSEVRADLKSEDAQ